MGPKEQQLMMGSVWFVVAWMIFTVFMAPYVKNQTKQEEYKIPNMK